MNYKKTYIILFFIYWLFLPFSHFIFLNCDTGFWFYLVKQTILYDVSLYKEIYQINFPGMYPLYLIPYILSDYFSINIMFPFIYFIGFLTSLSLYLIHKADKKAPLLAIFIVMSILPIPYFGEKEHFIFIFILPYIYYINSNLEQTSTIKVKITYVFFASFAIYIKPFYALVIIFLELFLIYKHRSLKHIFRIENILFISFGIIYIIAIYVFFKDFFINIVPDLINYRNNYDVSHSLSIEKLFFFLFTIIVSSIVFLTKKKFLRTHNILLVSLFSFLAIIYIQYKFYPYHYYPFFAYFIVLSQYIDKKTFQHAISLFMFIILFIVTLSIYQREIFIRQAIYPHYQKYAKSHFYLTAILQTKLPYLFEKDIEGLYSASSTGYITSAIHNKNMIKHIEMIKKEIITRKPSYITLDNTIYTTLRQHFPKVFNAITKNYIQIEQKQITNTYKIYIYRLNI